MEGLLLTHAHFDHVLDAAAIQKRFKCPIYAFATPSPDLTLEGFLRSMDSSLRVPHYEVTHLVKDGDPLSIAGADFTCLHIPGHSLDSLAFHNADSDVVFSGDTVMSFSVGRSDFPGGDHSHLIRGIREKLMTLPDNTRVFPGHGTITTIGEERLNNAFLS